MKRQQLALFVVLALLAAGLALAQNANTPDQGQPVSASTGAFTGAVNAGGPMTVGGVVSAAGFDGGWVAGTTGSFTSDVRVDGVTRTGNIIPDGGSRLCLNGTGACSVYYASDTFGGVAANFGGGFNGVGAHSVTGQLTTDDYANAKSGLRNTGTAAACTNTAAVCINDPAGFEWTNGSGATVGVGSVTGLISGDTGISSGAFAVTFQGVAGEGSNGQGGYLPTTIGRGSKFRQVTCSCRVAGSGGTTGIVLSLMEDGAEVDTQEINAGADTNACDDAAGTLLSGDFNYTFSAAKAYTLQVKSTTDCAGNPTDCLCNTDVTR